ncbi:MAG: DUF2207 domain-containing protein, partial [Methanomicrobiales archaeon]|nr:DUF2207 domain-containing protein [Methanomicrobiales archaeon]
MSEKTQLQVVVGAGLLLGLIAFAIVIGFAPAFDGDLTVTSYNAVLSDDGRLSEEYTYHVGNGGEYRMLYRIWQAPVTVNASYSEPYISLVSMTPAPGTTGYVKDLNGKVAVFGS